MTDGILLAELHRDRDLRRYDTLIIDEAHERSLNIDFILGYLRQLLPRRPDLKVIVTSATIDTARFARHFASDGVDAPSSRSPAARIPSRSATARSATTEGDAGTRCRRSATPSTSWPAIGDMLVFLSGEREIHDTADFLRRRDLPDTEVLPLYARLSSASSTASSSPTAAGGSCSARTSPRRRSPCRACARRRRRHGPHLPLQPAVEGAAAADRAGVAGVGRPAGRALRARRARRLHPPLRRGRLRGAPEFTEPEILRTNLAASSCR